MKQNWKKVNGEKERGRESERKKEKNNSVHARMSARARVLTLICDD